MDVLHEASVEVEGGRTGRVRAPDGSLALDLALPGAGAAGPNPEQLFAAAYGASFGSTLDLEARQRGILLGECSVTARVALGHGDSGCFALAVALRIHLPGLDLPTARHLVKAAHAECPYARMGRGNIEVRLLLAGTDETGDWEI